MVTRKFRRRVSILLAACVLSLFSGVLSPARAATLSSVRFYVVMNTDNKPNIKLEMCGTAPYRKIQTQELRYETFPVIRSDYDPLDGCDADRTPVVSAELGVEYEVGITVSNVPTYQDVNMDFYRVKLTPDGDNVEWSYHHRGPQPPITKLAFSWSKKHGGSIVASYCVYNEYYELTSSLRLSEGERQLGTWEFPAKYGCASRFIATGVDENDRIEFNLSSSDIDPLSRMESVGHTTYVFSYIITRTRNGLACEKYYTFPEEPDAQLPC